MVRRRRREGALEWAGISGSVEPGETPEQAAVREVSEEVGLDVVVERRLGDRVHPYTHRHLIYFACRPAGGGEPVIAAPDEVEAVEWCDLPTVLERWAGLGPDGIYPPVRQHLERSLTTSPEID
jgi:8-oxo-dGTP diphosphatase